jgi:hypothetical protein
MAITGYIENPKQLETLGRFNDEPRFDEVGIVRHDFFGECHLRAGVCDVAPRVGVEEGEAEEELHF